MSPNHTPSLDALRAHCSKGGSRERPWSLVGRGAVPRNPSARVLQRGLRERVADIFIGNRMYAKYDAAANLINMGATPGGCRTGGVSALPWAFSRWAISPGLS
ncbi:hypothetical protein [Cupriavidus pinatubonensis]|uniref:hypothetical protein n=1 Tax=Cupriavidus pinatubonensis TaxID=248026 RepID=UPI00112BFD6E|nr:hypothetical protein [Cupriavidus pinatubonensis]